MASVRSLVFLLLLLPQGRRALSPGRRWGRRCKVVRMAGSNVGLPSNLHVVVPKKERCDVLRRGLSKDGFVSVKAVDCTAMVAEVCRRQKCRKVAATALGRALASVALIADGIEDEETFQVRFEGDGPLGGLLAMSNGRLEARGYVGNPEVAVGSVGGAVGKGQLKVVRLKNLPGEEVASPFSSIVDIVTGEIAQDINYFVATSEQREGALAAGVAVEEEEEVVGATADSPPSRVVAAGGWRIELLPNAPKEVADQVLANVDAVLNAGFATTDLLLRGESVDGLVRLLFTGMDYDLLPDAATPAFKCSCSDARVFRTLALLPRDEVMDILQKNDKIEAKCEFCATVYTLTPQQIIDHLAAIDKKD